MIARTERDSFTAQMRLEEETKSFAGLQHLQIGTENVNDCIMCVCAAELQWCKFVVRGLGT